MFSQYFLTVLLINLFCLFFAFLLIGVAVIDIGLDKKNNTEEDKKNMVELLKKKSGVIWNSLVFISLFIVKFSIPFIFILGILAILETFRII